jgi:GT2 family glycosyltransferase
MNGKVKITASIVLFKENSAVLEKTIVSFLETPISKQLFLIDNSPTDILKDTFNYPEVVYIFVGKNIGFGKAHNVILSQINSNFHLILNPDVTFTSEVILDLIKVLEKKTEVSFITPKVTYPSNEIQNVCRKHPTFFDLINRRLKVLKSGIKKNTYGGQNLEKLFYPDFIHGCFMLFKTEDLKRLKGFDERYFLYMEDADICRKIDSIEKKKLYFPNVKITHQHRRGSSKSLKLFFYHLSSAIKYFLKWGI